MRRSKTFRRSWCRCNWRHSVRLSAEVAAPSTGHCRNDSCSCFFGLPTRVYHVCRNEGAILGYPHTNIQNIPNYIILINIQYSSDIQVPFATLHQLIFRLLTYPSSQYLTHLAHLWILPSGKRLHNYGQSPCLMGKSTISMVIFNSYFDITRGYRHWKTPITPQAVAIHSTNYVNVKGNVAFDIIGHMCASCKMRSGKKTWGDSHWLSGRSCKWEVFIAGWWFGTWLLWLSIQLGMSSSQLTNSIIFQRGRAQPPTRRCL